MALARGQGCRVWDADGREYLDLIAGIAVSALGHAHPAIVEAVARQVAALAHTSNLFLHEREVELAERLLGLLGADGRVFFANSGTEANEAALKLVRAPASATGSRPVIVAAEHGFHGRTMGALALTGKASIREPFGPFGLTVRFVPFGDAAALRAAVGPDCAAVFLEPGLGEGGVVPAPAGLPAARPARPATRPARCWSWTRSRAASAGPAPGSRTRPRASRPTCSRWPRGSAAGCRSARASASARRGTGCARGDHGSTFGGNPVACAAALAVLDTIERDGLLAQAAAVGEQLAAGLQAIEHPLVAGVRGRGLWLAVVLTAGRPRPWRRPPGGPGSWSTRCSRTRSGWRRR